MLGDWQRQALDASYKTSCVFLRQPLAAKKQYVTKHHRPTVRRAADKGENIHEEYICLGMSSPPLLTVYSGCSIKPHSPLQLVIHSTPSMPDPQNPLMTSTERSNAFRLSERIDSPEPTLLYLHNTLPSIYANSSEAQGSNCCPAFLPII